VLLLGAAPGIALAEDPGAPAGGSQPSESELAAKSQNPVADLISIPFQNNLNFSIGPHDRKQNVLNIQPVIPFHLNEEWNLITRTILPLVYQPDVADRDGGTFGLGDINPSLFLSPAKPGGLIWGVGPTFLLRTGTQDEVSAEKWGLGPTAVALFTPKPWVIGALVNNVWSVAGNSHRPDINQMTLQYFINYNLPDGWYLTSSPILTANWKEDADDTWIVPIGAGAGKVFRIGKLPFNAQLAAYYNAVTPDDLPAPSWQLRAQITLLLPR
jgi:hypothetical protein